jgi:hypothetical protein
MLAPIRTKGRAVLRSVTALVAALVALSLAAPGGLVAYAIRAR